MIRIWIMEYPLGYLLGCSDFSIIHYWTFSCLNIFCFALVFCCCYCYIAMSLMNWNTDIYSIIVLESEVYNQPQYTKIKVFFLRTDSLCIFRVWCVQSLPTPRDSVLLGSWPLYLILIIASCCSWCVAFFFNQVSLLLCCREVCS